MLPDKYDFPEDDDNVPDIAPFDDKGPHNHDSLAARGCEGPEDVTQGVPVSPNEIVPRNTTKSNTPMDNRILRVQRINEAINDFCKNVPAGRYISILCLSRTVDAPRCFWCEVGKHDLDSLGKKLHALDSQGYDIYISMAFARSPCGSRMSKPAADGIQHLWVEIDPEKLGTPGNPVAIDAIIELLRSSSLPPSRIVRSGGGLHVYWQLTDAVEFSSGVEKTAVEAIITGWEAEIHRRLSRAFGGKADSVGDLARVLRVAGTHNHKYDPPRLVTTCYEDTVRHQLSDFQPYASRVTRTSTDTAGTTPSTANHGWRLEDQPHTCLEDIETVIRRVKAKHGDDIMVDGNLSGYDGDRNRRDMGFCSRVGWCCGFDAHVIDAVYRRTDFARLKWDEPGHRADGLTYGELTLSKICTGEDVMTSRMEATNADNTGKPIIIENGPDTNAVLEAYKKALVPVTVSENTPKFYTGKDNVFRLTTDTSGAGRLDPLTKDSISGEILRVAQPVKQQAKGFSYGPPDPKLMGALLADDRPPYPPVLGVLGCPFIREDRTLVLVPGYDPHSRWIYCPPAGFVIPPIPEFPTKRDAVESGRYLQNNPYFDIRYLAEADFAAALASLLAPFLRPFVGRIPFFLMTATKKRTGKGLHVNVNSLIVSGRYPHSISWSRDEEEMRKRITSTLLSSPTVACFDNEDGVLASKQFEKLMTDLEWSDRLLGLSKNVTLPNTPIWYVTGNNVTVKGSLAQRYIPIRQDAQCAEPWKRTGFKHPDLEAYCLRERGVLLACLLTMARAYFVAGCPSVTVPTLGGYDAFVQTAGGILAYAEVPGFLTNMDEVSSEDAEWEAFLLFMAQHTALAPISASSVYLSMAEAVAKAGSKEKLLEPFPDEIVELFSGAVTGGTAVRKLAKLFALHANTRYGRLGLFLVKGPVHDGIRQWQVRATRMDELIALVNQEERPGAEEDGHGN